MRHADKWFVFAILAATLLIQPRPASAESGNAFSITPFVGWTRFDREFKDSADVKDVYRKDALYYGGRIGVRLASPLWLEVAGGITLNDNDLKWSHLSGNLLLVSPTPRAVNPFLSVGGGVSEFKPQVSESKHDGVVEAAGGVFVRLTDFLSLRLEARNVLLLPKTQWTKAHYDNVILGAGLTFGFGGKAKDSDGDGVPDRLDKCPDTPVGCVVDATGCNVDSDGDGVCDGLDRCASTPRGARVDANGCPKDPDGDGVFDGLDKCPDTPNGCQVDATGCPIDADGDGVCDGLDQCPNTATGCTVDAKGCPLDSDGDGVCDGLDKCANTPAGSKVDAGGCPPSEVQLRETELLDTGMIRLQDVKFETAKSDILPESLHSLDVVGEVLSKWPQLKIEVGGHCDSRGSDAYNLALSRRRVASVRTYLLGHYPKLDAAQMTARGYGEARPLVPNSSPENMARNRRVEFVVLNKAVLKQLKP
jgi:outer membrane protein OmpA-like peptidoglycan-associated protein